MGYFDKKQNDFLEHLREVFSSDMLPQATVMRKTGCSLEKMPYMYELLLDIADTLIHCVNDLKNKHAINIEKVSEDSFLPNSNKSANATLERSFGSNPYEEIQRTLTRNNRHCDPKKQYSMHQKLPKAANEKILAHFCPTNLMYLCSVNKYILMTARDIFKKSSGFVSFDLTNPGSKTESILKSTSTIFKGLFSNLRIYHSKSHWLINDDEKNLYRKLIRRYANIKSLWVGPIHVKYLELEALRTYLRLASLKNLVHLTLTYYKDDWVAEANIKKTLQSVSRIFFNTTKSLSQITFHEKDEIFCSYSRFTSNL